MNLLWPLKFYLLNTRKIDWKILDENDFEWFS